MLNTGMNKGKMLIEWWASIVATRAKNYFIMFIGAEIFDMLVSATR
jgi:hypothetical protein